MKKILFAAIILLAACDNGYTHSNDWWGMHSVERHNILASNKCKSFLHRLWFGPISEKMTDLTPDEQNCENAWFVQGYFQGKVHRNGSAGPIATPPAGYQP